MREDGLTAPWGNNVYKLRDKTTVCHLPNSSKWIVVSIIILNNISRRSEGKAVPCPVCTSDQHGLEDFRPTTCQKEKKRGEAWTSRKKRV